MPAAARLHQHLGVAYGQDRSPTTSLRTPGAGAAARPRRGGLLRLRWTWGFGSRESSRGWGLVVSSRSGWRAQFAEPAAFIDEALPDEVRNQLVADYNVPLYETKGQPRRSLRRG